MKKKTISALVFTAAAMTAAVLWTADKRRKFDPSVLSGVILAENNILISPSGFNMYTENEDMPFGMRLSDDGTKVYGGVVKNSSYGGWVNEGEPLYTDDFTVTDLISGETTVLYPTPRMDSGAFEMAGDVLYYLDDGTLYKKEPSGRTYMLLKDVANFDIAGDVLCGEERYSRQAFWSSLKNADAGGERTYFGFEAQRPVFSPDGRFVAYEKPFSDHNELYIRDIKTDREYMRKCSGIWDYCFSPDGHYLAVSENSRHLKTMLCTEIYVWDFKNDKNALIFDRGNYGPRGIGMFWGDAARPDPGS